VAAIKRKTEPTTTIKDKPFPVCRVHYPAFNEADLQSLSYGNAGRLYPALKARIEQQQ